MILSWEYFLLVWIQNIYGVWGGGGLALSIFRKKEIVPALWGLVIRTIFIQRDPLTWYTCLLLDDREKATLRNVVYLLYRGNGIYCKKIFPRQLWTIETNIRCAFKDAEYIIKSFGILMHKPKLYDLLVIMFTLLLSR
jgi:hypothetical protein